MKKIIILCLLASCSPLSELIIQEPEEDVVSGRPTTKSNSNSGSKIDYFKALHYAQSNHITMLVKHIELKDSVYIQTLTKEDFKALGFTKEEQDFGDYYLKLLNEQLKEDINNQQ